MRRTVAVIGLSVSVATMLGQEIAARPTPMIAIQPTPIPEIVEIWRIDLDPVGLRVLPEKTGSGRRRLRLHGLAGKTDGARPQGQGQGGRPAHEDLNQEAVYQIDLVPSGRMIAKENPTLKNGTFTFHTWLDNKFMSLRQTDVIRIMRLTGIPAFRAQEEVKGAEMLVGNLPMEGGGTVTIISGPPPEPVNPANAPAPATAGSDPNAQGNWIYNGVPGVTDGYAPPNAVVDQPGDPPQAAPNPQPPN